MSRLLNDISQMYHMFRKEDLSHRRPDTVFLSTDLFQDLMKNCPIEHLSRNPKDGSQWHVIGLDIHIIENKRNFIHVVRLGV